MKKCFGYVRVSTQKQGEGVSLEAQRDAILGFSERNGITIVKWFEEKETAAKSGRPIFLAMMKQLMKQQADGVVLHKVDRGARNLADWAKFAELADAGIDVHFANENLDFRSRGGRLTADIQAVIAADYIRNLRDECIKGIDGRLKQGLYPFKAPVGYVDNGGGKVKTIHPIRGPLVIKAFELYASGKYSLRSLPIALERIGLVSPSGKRLAKNCIEKFLSNPFYCGLIRTRRAHALYQGIHQPLISATLFEAVQDVKAGRTLKKVTKLKLTYRGLFRCALCDTAMIPERQKGHVYYRCQTRFCPTKTVREEALELEITKALSRVRMSDADISKLESEITAWIASRNTDSSANTYSMQLSKIEEKLERLTDALIDHLVDQEVFSKRKEVLFLEKIRLNEAIEASKKLPDPAQIQKFLELVKNLALTYGIADVDEKGQIVQFATSNRTVDGKNVYVEPANWLFETEEAIAGLIGGDSRPTSRSSPDVINLHVEKILESLKGYEDGRQSDVDDSSSH
jgi:site-specific DNA recombinase